MNSELLINYNEALISGSLTDEQLMAQTGRQALVKIIPDANVVKIGGQSFIDRGRSAVFPLIDEIVANLPRHKMIIGTGAGTRARHAYSVGLDLGMPTGVLSVLGTFVSMQNARMIHYLLAKHGVPFIEPAQFAQLPLYLEERRAAVFFGMPPYTFWHQNPAVGRIPPHRTDAGCFLLAECFGCKSLVLVKDVEGVYDKDPKGHPGASLIRAISATELERRAVPSLPFDRVLLRLLGTARLLNQFQVVNGHKPELIEAAINGEHVGTIVFAG